MVNDLLYSFAHVRGQELTETVPAQMSERPARGIFTSVLNSNPSGGALYFDKGTLSKHMLMLGSIGRGKTSYLYNIINRLIQESETEMTDLCSLMQKEIMLANFMSRTV
jgi:hypothetical protein